MPEVKPPWLDDESWQHKGMKEPKALKVNSDLVPEFPIDCLSPMLKAVAEAIVDRVQCPIDLAVNSLLAVASLAIQSHLYVVGLKYSTSTSLHVLTIGKSGERKTTADNLAIEPVIRWQKQFGDSYKSAYKQYEIAHARWKKAMEKNIAKGFTPEAADEAIKIGQPPEPPLRPERLCSDPTYEGLYQLLQVGYPSIGLFTSEGGTFVGGYAMNKDNRIKTIGNFNKLWDFNSPIDRTRGAKDDISQLHGRKVVVNIMLQDELADELYGMETVKTQGWFGRVLACKPKSLIGSRMYEQDDPATAATLERYNATMLDILNWPIPTLPGKPQEISPYPLTLSEEAKERWIEYYDEVERFSNEQNGLYKTIIPFAAKACENLLRLSGVMTGIENFNSYKNNPLGGVVSGLTLDNNTKIMDYYLKHQMLIVNESDNVVDINNAIVLRDWIQDRLFETRTQFINLRDIQRLGPSRFQRDEHTRERAIAVLEEKGWLEQRPNNAVVQGFPIRNDTRIWKFFVTE